jgi:hypothetical protein
VQNLFCQKVIYCFAAPDKPQTSYHKVLVAPPPLPIDNPLKKLTALSLDEDNNWRLEIWRQLDQLPASPKRDAFQKRLISERLD